MFHHSQNTEQMDAEEYLTNLLFLLQLNPSNVGTWCSLANFFVHVEPFELSEKTRRQIATTITPITTKNKVLRICYEQILVLSPALPQSERSKLTLAIASLEQEAEQHCLAYYYALQALKHQLENNNNACSPNFATEEINYQTPEVSSGQVGLFSKTNSTESQPTPSAITKLQSSISQDTNENDREQPNPG